MIQLPVNVTVSWLLDHVEEVPGDAVLCLPKRPLKLEDECMVVDWRVLGPDDDVTPQAVEKGLTMGFGVQRVEDILANLGAQTREPLLELKLRAWNHYLKHDAFISLT